MFAYHKLQFPVSHRFDLYRVTVLVDVSGRLHYLDSGPNSPALPSDNIVENTPN